MPDLHINNPAHYADFIQLNEQWIARYFQLEDADHKLAANPGAVVDQGGYILSLTEVRRVIGVCALFSQGKGIYELARLAVDEKFRRLGHADRLIKEALLILNTIEARKVTLMSNTCLMSALNLYRKHEFHIVFEGSHPIYARTNIIMEKYLRSETHA